MYYWKKVSNPIQRSLRFTGIDKWMTKKIFLFFINKQTRLYRKFLFAGLIILGIEF